MATSQFRQSLQQICENHQGPLLTRNVPLNEIYGAVKRVRRTARAETEAAAAQDRFTFYKTYLDTNVSLLGDQVNLDSDEDGKICHSGGVAAHGTSVDDAQPQARGHTAAYKLAVRLTNRSNGAPLATIIEQGSYSTLNSHGSLLSVGRFPSNKAADHGSPGRGSWRRSRSLDEKALHGIQEDLAREHDTHAVAVSHARLYKDYVTVEPPSGTATSLTSYRFETQPSLSSQSDDELMDHDDQDNQRGKGFLRGVMQTVRGVSRTRSRSSSITYANIKEDRDSPLPAYRSNKQLREQDAEHSCLPGYNRGVSTRASEGAAISPDLEDQARNRAISPSGCDLPARIYPHLVQSRSEVCDTIAVSGSLLPALLYRNATRTHEPPFPAPVVNAETRDVAWEDGTIEALKPHYDISDTSARYTFDDVSAHCRRPSSEKDANCIREVFTGQNASFCSTLSTSYSGTVLGVDLDLQHDTSHSIRRSQSPPTPVWFTPQMIELERQASCSDSPEAVNASRSTQLPCRSITSSALESLLPIAANSGIVQPNYNTPKISFYSPSGNLIQPESSSPAGTSASEYGGSPTITTSHYNRQNIHQASLAKSLPIRPSLVPMTTPPIQKTPLPLHLRHHHNYRQREQPQIIPGESSVLKGRSVKGCDGVVRENSLTPRSGVFFPHGKDRIHRSSRLAIHDLKTEAKFYKSRLLTLAATQSFVPSIRKGKTLQKRRVHSYNTYAKKPHMTRSRTRKGGYREEVLGPFAAHTLRVCFCQPYDGESVSTRGINVGACMTGDDFFPDGKPDVDRDMKDVERLLPNARVVGSRRRSEGVESRGKHRRDSVPSKCTRRVSYTDAAKKKVS